jgi:hypothetical protein
MRPKVHSSSSGSPVIYSRGKVTWLFSWVRFAAETHPFPSSLTLSPPRPPPLSPPFHCPLGNERSDFISLVRDLTPSGEIRGQETHPFEFRSVDTQHESYRGKNAELMYFVRVVVVQKMGKYEQKFPFWVRGYEEIKPATVSVCYCRIGCANIRARRKTFPQYFFGLPSGLCRLCDEDLLDVTSFVRSLVI